MNRTVLILLVLLQVTSGGVFIDSGTYYIAENELWPVDELSDVFGVKVGEGAAGSDYWLHRITFMWFSFEIHEMFNDTGPQNGTLFAQLLPFSGKKIETGDTYEAYPNTTVFHEKGQTWQAFLVKFDLTNTNESIPITSCRVTSMWTLEWEYHAAPDYTLLIVGIVGVVMLIVTSLFCWWRRKRGKSISKLFAERKRLLRKEKKQEKEGKKLRGKGNV